MSDISYPEEKPSQQIGIFLGKQKFERLVSRLNGRSTALLKAVSDLGISPIWFTAPQSQLANGMIYGATKGDSGWHMGYYPLPKVIYDRALFGQKNSTEGKKVRDSLAEQGIKFVNTVSAFSKWTTHIDLAEDNLMAPNLPHTVLFNQVSDLRDMLSQYPKVCVKSVWGSRGKEVLFVEQGDQEFLLLYPNGTVKTYKRMENLAKEICQFMENKQCIIQQRIDLATWKNRILDIRVLLQKVSLTRWDCTALCLRLALPGRGLTSTSQGSKVTLIAPILKELWPSQYQDMVTQVEALAVDTAKTLETKYGRLGELGIDIGIDRDGRLWLFEVNGKPGKTTVKRLKQNDLIRLAWQRPLIYAEMLVEE